MFKERRKLPKGSLVYVSGPITGRSEQEWKLHFGLVADGLRKKGFVPVSPADIGDELEAHCLAEHPGFYPAWKDYLLADLKRLADCNAIIMLKGWWDSKGAHIEHDFAEGAGIDVWFEEELEEMKW